MQKCTKKFMRLVMFILSCGLAGFTCVDTSQYCMPVPIYPALLTQILLMHPAINQHLKLCDFSSYILVFYGQKEEAKSSYSP